MSVHSLRIILGRDLPSTFWRCYQTQNHYWTCERTCEGTHGGEEEEEEEYMNLHKWTYIHIKFIYSSMDYTWCTSPSCFPHVSSTWYQVWHNIFISKGLWSKRFLGLFTNLSEGSSFDNLAPEHFLFGLEEIVTSFLQRQSSCKMKFCPYETKTLVDVVFPMANLPMHWSRLGHCSLIPIIGIAQKLYAHQLRLNCMSYISPLCLQREIYIQEKWTVETQKLP